jgi:anti-sigma28 factor (negative regulator of flagellin synthesis)
MKIILAIIFMAFTFLANSQSANASKRTFKAPSKETKTRNSSSSVSIQNSDSSYSFKAHFDSDRNEKVKTILMDNLDSKYMISKDEALIWQKLDSDEIVYTITFKNGSLKMNVDKDLISGNTAKKFEILGNELRETISNN